VSAEISVEDGLTVLRVPGSGPHRGALVVRLGAADGRPHQSGAAHLLEHHALAPLLTDPNVAGMVTPLTMALTVGASSAQAVADRLGDISTRLLTITDDDLNRERSVLRAEEQHGGSLIGTAAMLRYGLRGAGQCALRPFGEQTMRAADLTDFADPFLTRANAALVLTDEVPLPNLELNPGPSPPVPTLPDTLGQLPGAVESDGFAPAITGVLVPGPRAVMTAALLEIALLETLRAEAGLAYPCDVSVQDIASDAVLLCCVCDAPPAHAERAIALMLETIDRVATAGPTAHELDRAREGLPSSRDHRAMVHWALDQAQHGLCRGLDALRDWTVETHLAVTGDEIREEVASLQRTLLALGPDGSTPATLPPFLTPVGQRVAGQRYRRRRAPHNALADTAITVGPEGLGAEDLHGAFRAIRTADAAVLVEQLGGGISVLGVDGSVIEVDPRDLRDGANAVAAVRAAFAATPTVPLAGAEQAVHAAADGVVTSLSAGHVDLLPDLLETGETVQCIEEATLKLSAGALVVTDRRVLFLRGIRGTTLEVWRHDQIGSVRARRPVPGWNYLHVELDGRTRKFGFVKRERLERARDALAPLATREV
jgi:hypothetical protein